MRKDSPYPLRVNFYRTKEKTANNKIVPPPMPTMGVRHSTARGLRSRQPPPELRKQPQDVLSSTTQLHPALLTLQRRSP
jgi:hypothetical protein